MDSAAWAYVAGFVDGEGHIGIYDCGTPRLYPRLQIVNTNLEVLQWLHDELGGALNKKKMSAWGRKPCWVLSLTGKPAADALSSMLPFLRIKKALAVSVLAQVAGRYGLGEVMKNA